MKTLFFEVIDIFPKNVGDCSEEQGEKFHQYTNKMKKSIKAVETLI